MLSLPATTKSESHKHNIEHEKKRKTDTKGIQAVYFHFHKGQKRGKVTYAVRHRGSDWDAGRVLYLDAGYTVRSVYETASN